MSQANQILDFVLGLATGQPWGRFNVPALIADLPRVKGEFTRFLEAGGRVMVGQGPILNFDTVPFIPNNWEIRESDQIKSRVKGMWEVLIGKIGLHLDAGQQGGKTIRGHNLKKKLESQPVLPAHVLDYLLVHPELIPESWKGKAIFFWGTIYRSADGSLYVRYLGWRGGRWGWHFNWLVSVWFDYNPCAVSAS